jgi:hypothetical protein
MRYRGRALLCPALCWALAFPAHAEEPEEKVKILVETVDLTTGEVRYRVPPRSPEVVTAVIARGLSKNLNRLAPGKQVWVRIEPQGSDQAIVWIEGSRRWEKVALIVGGLLLLGLFLFPLEGGAVYTP